MRTIRRRIRSDREGAVLVLVALGMVVFLGFAALTVDLGMAYAAKAEAQRYADALSLAGASAYLDYSDPLDPLLGPEAISRVREYQALNAVRGRILADDDVLIEVLNAQQRVRVTVTRDELPTFFAGILGINEMTVGAVAAAEASAAASSRCVKPFAIPDRWEEGSTDPVQDYNGDQLMDFNIEIPCNGSGCSPNEIWTFEEGVDQYRPLNEMGTTPAWPDPAVATSWGSTWADGENRDNGARILITPQSAQGTGTPGWYQYWKMPGSSGASDLTDAIAGCIDLQTLGVGSVVEADPQTGSIGNPVYEAIKQLWDPEQGGDGDIEWDEANGIPSLSRGAPPFDLGQPQGLPGASRAPRGHQLGEQPHHAGGGHCHPVPGESHGYLRRPGQPELQAADLRQADQVRGGDARAGRGDPSEAAPSGRVAVMWGRGQAPR